MKDSRINQVVGIEHFVNQAKKIVNMKAHGGFLLSWMIVIPFVFLMDLPVWIAGMISSGIAGWVYFCGADYVDEQVGIWVDKMMTVRIDHEEDEKPVVNPHPIKESTDYRIEINDAGNEPLWTVQITQAQMRDVCQAWDSGPVLVRSSLDSSVWPNLTRRWQAGDIQMTFRKLGLVDHQNRFIGGWGSEADDGPPEVEQGAGTPNGVGGSE